MDDYNIIKTHNYVDQGTTIYNTLIKEFLCPNYFKSEPRTTLYWVALIKEISCKENMHTYGKYWYDLLPENLSAKLITEYIEDPRGTIAANRFSDDEIIQLRQPQRILLFYFLKKIAQYEGENPRIIRNFNKTISEDIFFLSPRPAVPDKGFLTVQNTEADDNLMDISPDLILDCIVEDEQITRKYVITSSIIGSKLNLTQAYLAVPSLKENRLCVTNQELPLTDTIYPFCPDVPCPVKTDDHVFFPSIIITSTLLCMSEGVRHIKLTMDIECSKFLEQERFKFKITTEEGWRIINQDEVKMANCINPDGHFEFNFTFDVEYPPITPILEIENEEIYLKSSSAIMMGYSSSKETSFSVKQVDLAVHVCGLRPMAIRNQEMVLNLQDDYQPFGVDAELQSAFSFTHAELRHPELHEIDLIPKWVAVPENLNSYYKAYNKQKDNFKVKTSTVYQAEGALGYTTITNDQRKELFDPTITFEPSSFKAINNVCTPLDEEEVDPMNFNLYYQLQLVDQDFGQSEYPLLMTQYAIKFAKYQNALINLKNRPLDVNMPYIPMWSDLLINYRSNSVTWTPTSIDEAIDVYKNEPKGYNQYYGEEINLGEDQYGALYLGFEDPIMEGVGTLYFNGETGNPRAQQVAHTWWYLTDNKWEKLTDHILEDGTNGLTQTGIISWTIPAKWTSLIPANRAKTSTMMPEGLYWIKMTIKPISNTDPHPQHCGKKELKYYDSLMSLNGIFANACSITRQREELAESNNVSPLKAGSTLTLQDLNLNYEFTLPFNTSGQVHKESNLDFWARSFNRVRNRGRMVCEQDYEDLLLQDFRNLSVVKAIPRWQGRDCIDIVVINRQVYSTIPYSIPPLNSVKELDEIRETVFPFSTSFLGNAIELNIVNPCYQEVGFLVYLEFQGNATRPENELQLYEDLAAFVNPWRVKEDQPLQFGCWFDYAEIISFLQSRAYIEAVFDVKMGLSNGQRLTFPEDYKFSEEEILIVTEPNMIVVVDNPEDYERLGIGTMVIGKGFIVSDSSKEDMDEVKIENYE